VLLSISRMRGRARGFRHGDFVEDVGIVTGQGSHQQIVTENMIVHLFSDSARPRVVIRPCLCVSRFLGRRLYNEIKHVIRNAP